MTRRGQRSRDRTPPMLGEPCRGASGAKTAELRSFRGVQLYRAGKGLDELHRAFDGVAARPLVIGAAMRSCRAGSDSRAWATTRGSRSRIGDHRRSRAVPRRASPDLMSVSESSNARVAAHWTK